MPRKEKKYHFIYKTTNLLSGKYYLGMHSTDDPNDGYMGSGKRLRYSINKYGKDNHKVEILEFVESREELKKREAEIINLNEIAKEECMNLMVGGHGGNTGHNGFFSEEHRLKCSKAGNIAYAKRMKEDDEFRDKVSKRMTETNKRLHAEGKFRYDTFKGKKHSEDTKKKMSEVMKGKYVGENNPSYGTCWITKEGVNKKIKKEDLDTFINDGWIKGRKC